MYWEVYFEYGSNKQDEVKEIMDDLLHNHNIDFAHEGYSFDDDITDVRYDCKNKREANMIMNRINQISGIKIELNEILDD